MSFFERMSFFKKEKPKPVSLMPPPAYYSNALELVFAKLKDLEDYAQADHVKTAKLESMVAFMLQKQGSEQSRRPLEGEVVQGSKDGRTRVHFFASWYSEWKTGWEKFCKDNNLTLEGRPHEKGKG